MPEPQPLPATALLEPEQPGQPGQPETKLPDAADDELLEEDLLVEEISIDGMCGVY